MAVGECRRIWRPAQRGCRVARDEPEPDPVPDGLADRHSRAGPGQHPRDHSWRYPEAQGGAGLGGGASVDLVAHSLFAAAGLSALLQQSAFAFSLIKYAGAAYLVYLGVKALLSKEDLGVSGAAAPVGLKSVFVQAVASNVLNPKIAIFFLAFLPQFTDPVASSVALQLLFLGLTFALLTWAVFSAIACFSGTLGSWLRSHPSFAGGLRWLTGGVLIGLGLRLALPDRR